MPDTAAPPAATTAPAAEDGVADVVVSSTPAPPAVDDTPDFVAKSPIFINGIRAYNEGDAVTADAVKKNNLKDFVKKP